jgi:tetratricopeptide (TPR) repeat protein
MWHLDETLSSFQKVTESMPVESLDPALLVFQHAVELVSVGSGKEYSVSEKGSISSISVPLAETRPTVTRTMLRKPLEFAVAEPAPIIEQPLAARSEENQTPQEATFPTITRVATRSQNEAGKLERDILTYQTVTGINPKNARAWHTLGNLQRSAGQYDQAVVSLEKAADLDPRQEVFYYHLGLVYAAQNRFDDAIETFKKVIKINPEYNLAHATLAGYYRKLGKTEDSKYHMAIARRTIQDENEYNRACFEAICGNVDKAIELLKIALKEEQTTPDWVRRDPDFDNIRSDDRFQALIAG